MSRTILEESQWKQVELELICQKISVGLAISVTPHMSDKGTKLIRNQNIRSNYFDRSSVVYVSNDFANTQETKLVRAGDVISVRTGVNIGETCVVPDDFDGALTFTTLIVRPNNSLLDSFYLSQYMNSHLGRAEITRLTVGGGKENLNSGDLKKYRIFLPPIHVQKEIAEVLYTWDEVSAKIEKLIAAKQKFKKALMQKLLTGKLRFQKFGSVSWKLIKLGQVAEIRRGASPRPIGDPSYFSETGRGWVRIADVTASRTYLTQTTQYLSELGESKSVPVNPGDLIMSICATIGVPRIVKMKACIHDGFVVIRPRSDDLSRLFLYHFLDFLSPRLAGSGQPGTQKNLNTTLVSDISIPAISHEEQSDIATTLSLIDEEIYKLQEQVQQLQKQKRGLMQKLLTGEWRVTVEEAA